MQKMRFISFLLFTLQTSLGLVSCDPPCEGENCPPTPAPESIHNKQLVIVSIGDSYASGEGNPDAPVPIGSPIWDEDVLGDALAVREADICHRSSNNAHRYAINAIAPHWQPNSTDEEVEVIFRSFACAGAAIWRGLLIPQYPPVESIWETGSFPGVRCEHPDGGDGLLPAPCRLSQVEQVKTWLEETGYEIDILLISIGGNDIGFNRLISRCVVPKSTIGGQCNGFNQQLVDMLSNGCNGDNEDNVFCANTSTEIERPHIVGLENDEHDLTDAYINLIEEVNSKLQPQHIVITGYPNFARDYNGEFCNGWDDGFAIGIDMTPPDFPWNMLGGGGTKYIIESEAEWVELNVIGTLNHKIEDYVNTHQENDWDNIGTITFVDGIMVKSQRHGFCSANRWVNTFRDSWFDIQGSVWGAVHPNLEGHKANGDLIAKHLSQLLQLELSPNEVTIQGTIKVNDNGVFSSSGELSVKDSFDLNPLPTNEDYAQRSTHRVKYQYCVGNARVDLVIDFELANNRSLEVSRYAELAVQGGCYPMGVRGEPVSTSPETGSGPIASNEEMHLPPMNLSYSKPGETVSVFIDLTIENLGP